MCGLAGFLDGQRQLDPERYHATVDGMAARLSHRGPDDAGSWVDKDAGLALGFRRLAIIDRSSAGHQPMPSACGRYVLTFNGEIYNHRELRCRLAEGATTLRGHSDSEVLVAAIARWGFVSALARLDGMFAIALWDRCERRLWLARDRLGEKPLYYGRLGRTVLFGSELKAFAAHPVWTGEVDRGVIPLFMRYGYVPAPWSIFADIKKLPAGHHLSVSATGEFGEVEAYWPFRQVARAAAARPFPGSLKEAADELEGLIDTAVASRLAADVPVGAFLSGGIDSSLVVAAMTRARPGRVHSFAIGFPGAVNDESHHAAAVARHLGTTHTTLAVAPEDYLAVVPRLPAIYDEPFADDSQLPTAMLCALTRPHAVVALSGDGGDELFGGYQRFATVARLWTKEATGSAARRSLARNVSALVAHWHGPMAHRIRKGAERARHASLGAFYASHMSRWRDDDGLTRETSRPRTLFDDPVPDAPSIEQSLMLIDTATYLPDDLLVKMDRAGMAVGLEVRAPLLDHKIAEFAWSLPPAIAIAAGPKAILREVLHRRVPQALVDRPKQGFSPPVGAWLNQGLRDWADDLLSPARLARRGLLAPGPVASRWSEHRRGDRDWTHALWAVLMLEAWLDHAAAIEPEPARARQRDPRPAEVAL